MAPTVAFNAWVANEDYCPLQSRSAVEAIAGLVGTDPLIALNATASPGVVYSMSTFDTRNLMDLLITVENQSRAIATLLGTNPGGGGS